MRAWPIVLALLVGGCDSTVGPATPVASPAVDYAAMRSHYDTVIDADRQAMEAAAQSASDGCQGAAISCVASADAFATEVANAQKDIAALATPPCYAKVAPEVGAWLSAYAQSAGLLQQAARDIAAGHSSAANTLMQQASAPVAQGGEHYQRAKSLSTQAVCP